MIYLNVLLPLIFTWTFMSHCLRGQTGAIPVQSTANMLVVLVPPVHCYQPVQTRRIQVSTHITPLLYKPPQYHTLSLPNHTLLLPYHTFSSVCHRKFALCSEKKDDTLSPKNKSLANCYIALVYCT